MMRTVQERTAKSPWRSPAVRLIGHVGDIVLSSMAKGTYEQDGEGAFNDSRKNAMSHEPH
jgi:hypothetical protein